MQILKEVFSELLSMFLADARLTMTTLVLVAAIAVAIMKLGMDSGLAGALLLLGCLAIVIEAAVREARRRRSTLKR